MSDGLARFNALPVDKAERRLYSCLASRGWVASVARARPFKDLDGLLAAAESAFSTLSPPDWASAVAAHPRIGEQGGHAPESSEREQSTVARAAPETLAALAAENGRYEERFGHVFLIAAMGRGAEEILDVLRERMHNDRATEVKIAADELRKITRIRLERLVSE